MKALDLMVDFIKMSKVWSLCMEFCGAWQSLVLMYGVLWHMARSCHAPQNSIHKDQTLDIFILKINGKSQNVHTTELGYLGFQICSSVASKLREATPSVTSHAATLYQVRNGERVVIDIHCGVLFVTCKMTVVLYVQRAGRRPR